MQVDLPPELPQGGDYENLIIAIDVFSSYAFAYPISNPRAVNTAKAIIDVMTRLEYVPTVMIKSFSDFVSNQIQEIADLLGITLRNATTKSAQTVGVAERLHATTKTSRKNSPEEFRKQWDNYLPLAILNFNAKCHASIGCERCRRFHGRVIYNVFHHKHGLKFQNGLVPITDFADEVLRRTEILYDKPKRMYAVIQQIQKNLRRKNKSLNIARKGLLLNITT